MGGEGDDDDGGVGQGDLAGDGGPAGQGRALQAEEQEDAAEEALDGRRACPVRRASRWAGGRSGPWCAWDCRG